jgi:hypothetical protein
MKRQRVLCWGAILLGLLSISQPARAVTGAAMGRVAVIDTETKGLGFSTYSGTWTSVQLDSPASVRLAGGYLGYLRTTARIYAYNSTNDHWYHTSYQGIPNGEDDVGASIIFWTNAACYAFASPWALWRTHLFDAGEVPLGGGSGGTYAMVWTTIHGIAFHSASGQWMSQTLTMPPVGGLTNDGLGLVWTQDSVYCFDPTPGGWQELGLNDASGISAVGGGGACLVWGGRCALAYSGTFDSWTPFQADNTIQGGVAGGEIALLWTATQAATFDANTTVWAPVPLEHASGLIAPQTPEGDALSISPNPATADLHLRLAGGSGWAIAVIDAAGRAVRNLEAPATVGPTILEWDRLDREGHRCSAGVYWIQAKSRERLEARRVVLLN